MLAITGLYVMFYVHGCSNVSLAAVRQPTQLSNSHHTVATQIPVCASLAALLQFGWLLCWDLISCAKGRSNSARVAGCCSGSSLAKASPAGR